MLAHRKQQSSKILIMYMVTALLFLTSIELHIHTQETATTVEHGFAVDISSIASNLMPEGSRNSSSNEIIVSPESALKVKQSSVSLLAVFLLITILLTALCRTFIGRLRESHTLLPTVPFHGHPPLRAPPK